MASTSCEYSRIYSQGYSFDCTNGCCGRSLHQYCCIGAHTNISGINSPYYTTIHENKSSGAIGIVIYSLKAMVLLAVLIGACIRWCTGSSVTVRPDEETAESGTAASEHGTHETMQPTQSYSFGTYAPNTHRNPAFAPPPYSNTSDPTMTKNDALTTPQS
ncbi:hypothetical protein BsWGS_07609 [Bradybaena similaris]